MKRLNRLLAFAAFVLVFLCALALTAPLHGCARTGRAIGNLIESVGRDFSDTVEKLAGPEPTAVAKKEGDE